MKKFFLLSYSILSLFLFFSTNVLAQEKTGFAVTPPSFEINAKPGDVISNVIRIDNLSDFSLKIKARSQSFVAYGEGGQVTLSDEESSFSIVNWLKIEESEKTIKSKNSGVFKFVLNIPKNAEPGSHYGAIVFSPVHDQAEIGSGALVSQEIGALILIKIPGEIFEGSELIGFKSSEQIVKEDNVNLTALLSNTGNIHVKPYGFIALYDVLGRKVKTIEVKGRNILPGSRRLFEESFKFNGFGFYNAQLTLLYSGGGKVLYGKTSFIILNLTRSGPFLITLGVLLLILVIFRKRFIKALKIMLKG